MPAVPSQPDWYAILNVDPSADDAAIKAAHRRRARELHPDVNASDDATARMAEVNHARDILLNPHTRAVFDRERRRATPAAPRVVPRDPRPRTHATAGGRIRFTFDHARADRPVGEEAFEDPEPPAPQTDWSFDIDHPRKHDWYRFLDVPPWATRNEIQLAIAKRAPEATQLALPPEERGRRGLKLRAAWEVLGVQRSREAYDASLPPWRPRHDMPDLYRVIGVRPVASTDTIGAAVARHARALGPRPVGPARQREAAIREAWWVLRDPGRRAAYDAARAMTTNR